MVADANAALDPGDAATRFVTDWRECLTGNLDAVIVATPPATHGPLLRELVAKKIPVLLEKPLCLDLNEAVSLQECVTQSNVPVLIDHTQLFHPAYEALTKKLHTAGPPKFIYAEGMALGPFRDDVSMMWDWAPHDIALSLSLCNTQPISVMAAGNEFAASMQLTYQDGCIAWITNANVSSEKRRRLTIYCDDTMFVLDDRADSSLMEYTFSFQHRPPHPPALADGKPVSIPDGMPLTNVVECFIDGITGGSQDAFGLSLAVNVVQVLTFAQRCIDTAHPQQLDKILT